MSFRRSIRTTPYRRPESPAAREQSDGSQKENRLRRGTHRLRPRRGDPLPATDLDRASYERQIPARRGHRGSPAEIGSRLPAAGGVASVSKVDSYGRL